MELNSVNTKMANLKAKLSDIQKYKDSAHQMEEKYNNLMHNHTTLQSENKILIQNNKSLATYKDKVILSNNLSILLFFII